MESSNIDRISMNKNDVKSFSCAAIAALLCVGSHKAHAEWKLSVAGANYARQASPNFRLSLSGDWKSEDGAWDTYVNGFYEAGQKPFWNIDPDPVVYRRNWSDGGAFIGRTFPLTEGQRMPRPHVTDAIGSVWGQNQKDPMDMRVSGWIALGAHQNVGSGFSLSAAYSPIFIPTLDASIGFSNFADLQPDRWARLPPASLQVNSETLVPIRYDLELGRLSSILFQDQAALSIRYSAPFWETSLSAWSAPDPIPGPVTEGHLWVTESEARANVTIIPSFPRRNILGWRLFANQAFSFPIDIQLTYEPMRTRTIASLRIQLSQDLELGYLDSFEDPHAGDPAAGGRIGLYSDRLVWAQGKVDLFKGRTQSLWLTLRVEQHLLGGFEGTRLSPGMTYSPGSRWRIYAQAHVLSGGERSYFGLWRSIDHAFVGGTYLW